MKNFFKSLGEKLKSKDLNFIPRLKQLLQKTDTKKISKSNSPASKSSLRFDIMDIAPKILDPAIRGIIHKSFIIIFAVTSSYSIGKIAAVIVKGKTTTKRPMESAVIEVKTIEPKDYNTIKTADIFNTSKREVKPSITDKKDKEPIIDKKKICTTAKNSSPLPIALINTVVMQDSIKSIASVSVRSKEEATEIREGEILEGMAQIGRIERLKLIFKNLQNGRCEYVENEKYQSAKKSPINILDAKAGKVVIENMKNPAIKNEGNKFTIKKKFLNEKLNDIGTILTQARAVQINNPDGSLSFNLQEVEPGSIYTTLGLTNDDTITEIDGKKIKNINQIMDLFGKIREIDHLTLKVNRNGIESEMEYNLNE